MLTGSAALFAFVAPAPAMLAPHATSLMRRPHFPVAMSAETDVLLDGVTTEDDTPRPPPPDYPDRRSCSSCGASLYDRPNHAWWPSARQHRPPWQPAIPAIPSAAMPGVSTS